MVPETRSERERRGSYTATYSILHSRDGKVLYVNRSQEPAFFDSDEVEDDIWRYSRKIGESPRIMKMPHRNGFPHGIIAVWGTITLQQLDQESSKAVAGGTSPHDGLLIDFLGDVARSANEGLAIYRIDGGSPRESPTDRGRHIGISFPTISATTTTAINRGKRRAGSNSNKDARRAPGRISDCL
jgi:hypothetical protein